MALKKQKINLLIIGTGLYVCGRGTAGYGTILPAVMQSYKAGLIDEVLVASNRGESFETFDSNFKALAKSLGVYFSYKSFPLENTTNPNAFREAIKELPDPGVVIIATPDHLHFEMALAAIENGKHVLVVKPLVTTIDEANQLIRAAQKAEVYGAVEFHKRWDLANLKMKQALETGALGKPLYIHVEYSQRKIIPTEAFSSWVDRTNIFQYLGVHYADIIHFITQGRPRRLLATGQKYWLQKQGIDAYDAIQVLIEWSSGFVSTILTNWIDPNCSSAMSQQKMKIIGTKGRVESDQTNRGLRIFADDCFEEVNPYFCQTYPAIDSDNIEYRGYGIQSITQFLKDVQSIADGEHAPEDFKGRRPTFSDSLVSTTIVEAANLSLKNSSQWVYFGEKLEPYLE